MTSLLSRVKYNELLYSFSYTVSGEYFWNYNDKWQDNLSNWEKNIAVACVIDCMSQVQQTTK